MLELLGDSGISLAQSDARHGFGLFETIRVHEGGMPFLGFHLERMGAGAVELGLGALPSARDILDFARALPGFPEAALIRLFALDGKLIVLPSSALPPIAPRPWSAGIGGSAIRLPSSPSCRYKTLSYLDNRLLMAEAASRSCLDLVALSIGGELADGSRTNLFVVEEGRLLSPATSSGALPGVARRCLLESGLAHEAALSPAQASRWEAAMLVNSLRLAMPLTRFEGRELDPNHPLLSKAASILEEALAGGQGL